MDATSTRSAFPLGFLLILVSQSVSFLGSAMSGFGVSIWAWEKTGQATALSTAAFFFVGATMAVSPFAGALVDRWNRKVVMILSDLAAALSTAVLLVLYVTGRLQIWHLFVANTFSGAFQAFQWPAFSATTTLLVPKKHYARASAVASLAESAAQIAGPALGAALLRRIDLSGLMALDLTTMALAVGLLLIARLPQPETTAAGRAGRGSLRQEAAYGFRYIVQRPSLLGLQLIFFMGNLLENLAFTLVAPMLLARTGNNEMVLGSVQALFGTGTLLGSLALALWGGPRRRVHGVLMGWVLSALLGLVAFPLGRTPIYWAVVAFLAALVIPTVNASNQAIWQAKVPPDVQGRVFSIRRFFAQVSVPVSTLAAGPLADWIFEPAMQPGGGLAPLFGGLVGSGPGAGMALICFFCGLICVVTSMSGYAFRAIRHAEDILPDHDAPGLPEEAGRPRAEVPS